MNRTNLIVLRKTQYRETSLIVAGVAPDLGRLDMVVRGAKKLSSKSFPAVDLFREINVDINPQKKNLHSVYSADLLVNNDNISSFHQNYLAACEIARFVLRNSQTDIPSPELYQALKHIYGIMAEREMEVPYPALIKLTYLDEHGLLPEQSAEDSQKGELLLQLLAFASGEGEKPEINKAYWEKLSNWIDSLCRFHELV